MVTKIISVHKIISFILNSFHNTINIKLFFICLCINLFDGKAHANLQSPHNIVCIESNTTQPLINNV